MLKLQLQSKGFFRTITNTLFDKTILYIIFWIVLNIKYEKKSLRLNNLSYVKYWKTNKKTNIFILMHHSVIRLSFEPDYLPKRLNLMQKIISLYPNVTFMETFTVEFISNFELWDSTVTISYFVAASFDKELSSKVNNISWTNSFGSQASCFWNDKCPSKISRCQTQK